MKWTTSVLPMEAAPPISVTPAMARMIDESVQDFPVGIFLSVSCLKLCKACKFAWGLGQENANVSKDPNHSNG